MTDAASIVLAQTESSDTGGATDAVDNPTIVTEKESTDAGASETAGVVDGDTGTSETTGVDNEGDKASLETYSDFTAPEGTELDSGLIDQATPLFKELGLNQEQAQKLVDFQAAQVDAGQKGQAEAFTQVKQEWQDQTKNDAEIGGDKFEQSVSDARGALEKFGTPELNTLLNDFGVGNHPEMIRFMSKVGALTKEDVPGNPGGSPPSGKSRVDILYPSDS